MRGSYSQALLRMERACLPGHGFRSARGEGRRMGVRGSFQPQGLWKEPWRAVGSISVFM